MQPPVLAAATNSRFVQRASYLFIIPVVIILHNVAVLRVGLKFNPFQLVVVYDDAGINAVGSFVCSECGCASLSQCYPRGFGHRNCSL